VKVLLLGKTPSPLTPIVAGKADKIIEASEPIDERFVRRVNCDVAISYGYRHIVRQPVLDLMHRRIINLHISCLPWNRGADPNLWSFLEDTPKGVSIHYVDAGVDTGDLIAQRHITFDMEAGETLASTYDRLSREILDLFTAVWPVIARGDVAGIPQPPGGSVHRKRDKERYRPLLVDGWHTPVSLLAGKALGDGETNEQAAG